MNKCKKISSREELVLDSIFHIFILCLVLGMFYFLVASKVEGGSLEHHIYLGFKAAIKNWNPSSAPDTKNELLQVSNLFNRPNQVTEVYNEGLIILGILILCLLFFCLISVWLTMKLSAGKCPNLLKIVWENILLFGCIGIVEFLFFQNIARKYVPVMPSYALELIEQKL